MGKRLRFMVAYYGLRSTEGFRLEAERYARHNNGHIIYHHYEVGQPHRRTRPALAKAVQQARDADALLFIPRFEALVRDAVFLKLLWESGVEFIACDNKHASRITLPLLASVVIRRSQEISTRTKAALAKRKRRKSLGPLGTLENLTQEARLRGGAATKSRYQTLVSDELHELLLALRAEGKSLRQIAAALSDRGHRSKTGRPWSHTHIKWLLARCEMVERHRAARRAEWEAKKAVTR
jgi:DNA invertase Pin-like site-specific DNA recombinase